MTKKTTAKRPVTPEDLESLVRALGGLVRESVREEVRDALRDLERRLEARGLMGPIVRTNGPPKLTAEQHAERLSAANTPATKFDAIHDALEDGAIELEQAKKLLESAS